MARTLRRACTAVAGVALLVLTTACGGSADGEGGGGDASAPDEVPRGLIDEIFDQAYGDDDVVRERAAEMEALVAACMSEQGFEYTPVDWFGSSRTAPAEELDVEYGTLEFAQVFGYGATTTPFGEDDFVEPNEVHWETMSKEELRAWTDARWGSGFDEEGDEPAEYDWRTAGCQGAAQHEMDLKTGLAGSEYEALEAEIELMREAAADDPRMADLNVEWSNCMADAGFPDFTTLADAEQSIYDKLIAVYDRSVGVAEAEVTERVAAVKDEELATAVADLTCRDEVDYARVQAEIDVEYQQEFYDTHKTEVDAWREAVAGR